MTTCNYNLLKKILDITSTVIGNLLVGFRFYTVQMVLINRCSLITFTFRMICSNTPEMKTMAASTEECLLCIRNYSKNFRSHSMQPYKIVYSMGELETLKREVTCPETESCNSSDANSCSREEIQE